MSPDGTRSPRRVSGELENGLLGSLDAIRRVVVGRVGADGEVLALAEVEDRQDDVAVLVVLADLELVEREDAPRERHLPGGLARGARELLVLGLGAPAAGPCAGHE